MPFEITISLDFSAAHALRLYDRSLEPLHGHNWRVRVTAGAEDLDSIGVVMDFHELERRVERVIAPFRNQNLNEAPPFSGGINPSAENVAAHVARELSLPEGVFLVRVEAWETPACAAAYYPRRPGQEAPGRAPGTSASELG